MKTNKRYGREHEMLVLFYQVSDAITRVRENEMRPFGILSQVQAGVLYHLEICGKSLTISEISRRLIRKPHTISALVDRMELQGLVRKIREPDVRNQILIEITEKGAQAYKRASKMKAVEEIFSSITKEQRENLILCFKTMRTRAFHNLGENLQPPFP